jgi:hypothetical protein
MAGALRVHCMNTTPTVLGKKDREVAREEALVSITDSQQFDMQDLAESLFKSRSLRAKGVHRIDEARPARGDDAGE